MSEAAKAARAAMKAKAQRMGNASGGGSIDASGWTEPTDMHTEAKTGMRPISRRAFKAGGTVSGAAPAARADRAPRKSGGALTANGLMNRNMKDANEEREGVKHIGGMNTGGRARKAGGGGIMGFLSPAYAASKGKLPGWLGAMGIGKKDKDGENVPAVAKRGGGSVSDGTIQGERPQGGRLARKAGGRAGKGKMNVNIVIATGPRGAETEEQRPPEPPVGAPPVAPKPAPPPPPVGGPPMPPPGAPPPMPMAGPPPQPPVMRKAGGRIRSPKDLDAGAGSGEGRLEKIKLQRNAK